MLAHILPAHVVAVEAFDDPPDGTLFAEEAAVVAGAVDRRRREFTTARLCARTALARLGRPAVPIVPGPRGEPRWPAGIVGSLTHCEGYRAAALARADELWAIGVDAEPHAPLPDEVLDTVTVAAERSWLRAAPPGTHWDRLLFCAKEAVYKAWYPLTERWLDFTEAEVAVDPDAGTFRARLLVPGPVSTMDGRFTVGRGLVLTAVALLHPVPRYRFTVEA